MICSMEESVRANVLKLSYNRIRACKFSRRVKYFGKCMYVNCDIVAHMCQPLEAKIGEIPGFEGLTSFKIAHAPECRYSDSRACLLRSLFTLLSALMANKASSPPPPAPPPLPPLPPSPPLPPPSRARLQAGWKWSLFASERLFARAEKVT